MARKQPVTSPEEQTTVTAEAAVEAQPSEEMTTAVMESVAESENVPPTEGPSFISQILPAIGGSLSKAVYGTCYYASYGVVFGALTVAHLIPMNNIMGRAIKDGAADAQQAMEKTEAASTAQESVAAEEASLTA